MELKFRSAAGRRAAAGAAVLAALLLAGCGGTAKPAAGGGSPATVQVATNPKLGKILVDAGGKTLYVFTKDSKDTSNCGEGCVGKWPPLVVTDKATAGPGVTGSIGTFKRSDGHTQVSINGLPLYHFAQDVNPGDVGGQGVGGFWFAVRPDGSKAEAGGGSYKY